VQLTSFHQKLRNYIHRVSRGLKKMPADRHGGF
jgi:hypothetical protein